ncbi:MMPL family transporter [Larsenimonas salina]|uniref:MMPL family transporter n=1 Tax=Larsenimonas salina TaxID=1295565 RepID=UPI0020742F76|nr:hypothetical protein [Larsenimonas salina]MCM5705012.1 hypothetical protein [Larsenimonas salina]
MTPKTHTRLAWLWALMLLGCVVLAGWMITHGVRFDTRVTALLPDTHQSARVQQANAQLGSQFQDRFVLMVKSNDLPGSVKALAERLEKSPAVERLQWRPGDFDTGDPVALLGPARYRLLDKDLRKKIDAGDYQAIEQRALRQLFMPDGLDQHPIRDPYGLLDRWLAGTMALPFRTDSNLITLTHEGSRYAVLIGTLEGNPFSQSTQNELHQAVASVTNAHPDMTLLRSGMIFHAYEGAQQARQEISTFGLGALIGLLLILWLVFRSPKTMATLMVPLLAGGLFALAATLLVFGRLHLLTIAFGTSLIGIAIDYAIHMQCARAALGQRFALKPMLPGLALGLLSSVLAFAAQALTPMPGLRQMAFFAATGLIGAWLTVVLWLPRVTLKATPSAAAAADRLWTLFCAFKGRLTVAWALVGVVLALSIIGVRLHTNDSLQLLTTSSSPLLKDEQQVQSILGRDTGSRYLLLSAATPEQWQARAEVLEPLLKRLVKNGHLGGYELLTDHVPSSAHQDDNLERTRTLYDKTLASLYGQAGLPSSLIQKAQARLVNPPHLTLEAWLESPLGQADRRLWLGHSDTEAGVAGVIPLKGVLDDSGLAALERAARHAPYLSYEDRVARIATVLSELRRTIAGWVGGAFVVLAALLALRYRRCTWRVMAPAAGGVLITLAVLALAGTPVNLFHQLALLLVIGLGLDAGIFMAEHRARHAWLAITLSSASSLLAFGLLAFSATPVLHHIGLTSLIGLLSVWLLVPLVQPHTLDSPETPH